MRAWSMQCEPLPFDQFAFERGEEALAQRVAVVAGRTGRGTHASALAPLAEGDGGVLAAATRVMDDLLGPAQPPYVLALRARSPLQRYVHDGFLCANNASRAGKPPDVAHLCADLRACADVSLRARLLPVLADAARGAVHP